MLMPVSGAAADWCTCTGTGGSLPGIGPPRDPPLLVGARSGGSGRGGDWTGSSAKGGTLPGSELVRDPMRDPSRGVPSLPMLLQPIQLALCSARLLETRLPSLPVWIDNMLFDLVVSPVSSTIAFKIFLRGTLKGHTAGNHICGGIVGCDLDEQHGNYLSRRLCN